MFFYSDTLALHSSEDKEINQSGKKEQKEAGLCKGNNTHTKQKRTDGKSIP